MPPPSLCGRAVTSRRSLLASLWSVVTILTAIAFLTALIFTMKTKQMYGDGYFYYNNDNYGDNWDGYNDGGDEQEQNPQIAVTSRAMAFAALWTAILASLMTVFGTVVLGWQSPTGQYYTCCSSNVHHTTPLSLGSFIGALLMFANLTLVCSVLFGEFEIRDYQRQGEGDRDGDNKNNQYAHNSAVDRSSMAFSIMCMFLTVLYAGFAALTFSFSHSIIEEHAADQRDELIGAGGLGTTRGGVGAAVVTGSHFNVTTGGNQNIHHHGYDRYIGERFDVAPRSRQSLPKQSFAGGGGVGVGVPGTSVGGGFVAPTPTDVATLT